MYIIQACEDSTEEDDDSVLKSLVELCEDAPKVIRPHLNSVLQLCHKVDNFNSYLE